MQKRASERVTVPPELRSEVRFSPKGEQLSTSARARGTVTTNTLLQRGEGSSDQHAAAARRGRVTRYVDVAADALPPLPEVLDDGRARGPPTAEGRGATAPPRDLARSSAAAATGRSTAAAELASQSLLPPPTPPRVIHASFERGSAERGGEHRRGGTGRASFTCYLRLALATCDLRLATCHLLLATCHLRLATCHLPLATCHLLLATCYLLLATRNSLLATYRRGTSSLSAVRASAERRGGGTEAGGGGTAEPHPASSIGVARIDSMLLPEHVPVSSSVVAVSRRGRMDTETDASHDNERALNERALSVLRRVKSKLGGSDFPGEKGGPHDVATQVNRLIGEAQSNGNLCQLYIGWCPFW